MDWRRTTGRHRAHRTDTVTTGRRIIMTRPPGELRSELAIRQLQSSSGTTTGQLQSSSRTTPVPLPDNSRPTPDVFRNISGM